MNSPTLPVPDRSRRCVLACLAAALVLFYMICPAAPLRWHDLYLAYGRAAIVALAAVCLCAYGLRGAIEARLLVWYALWMFITRLLNTDWYMQNDLDLVLSRVLCAALLLVGLVLDAGERRRLLDAVIAVAGAYYLLTALLALYACIFGVYFYLPPEHTVFGRDDAVIYASFIYIVAWGTNRTISAVWFYLAWCMMAYEFFRCKNKLWRIPIGLAWFIFHLAIAFCFCRSIKLAVCVNTVMLVVLGILHRPRRPKRKALTAVLAVVLAAATLVVTYKSFDWLTSATSAIYRAADVQIERTSDEFIGADDEDSADFTDPRDLSESISNISNRGEIYRSVIPTLRADPMRLLIGKYSSKVMDIPRQFLSYPYFHMHNFLLQTLMLTGVIGLALALVFTVLLVWRMIRLFFCDRADTAVKTLTLPLTGILIYGMFETILFTASADDRAVTDFRELFFFLIAGVLLGYYYELFPPKQRAVGQEA